MKYDDRILRQEKIKLINYQIIANVIFGVLTFFSLILIYNKKLDILNKKLILNKEDARAVDITRTIIILAIVLFDQYINYETRKITEIEGKDNEPINLNITSTYFLVIATIISLYATYITSESRFDSISLV